MRRYNLAYVVLTDEWNQITVTPTVCNKLIQSGKVLEMEVKALTDDDYDKVIQWEVDNNMR